jgi:hypothetical protein
MHPDSPYHHPNFVLTTASKDGMRSTPPTAAAKPGMSSTAHPLSFGVTPSLTFGFDHDEGMEELHAEESRVERLLAAAKAGHGQEGTGRDWSEMAPSSRYAQTKRC